MKGLNGSKNASKSEQNSENVQDAVGIAVVGMSGRFPGAPSVDALWQLIEESRSVFSRLKPEEIDDAFTDEERANPNYVPARPYLPDVDMFDAEFFGMFPREASVTDPQHRIFLEICWEALENAGYNPYEFDGLIGVFAGASMPSYLLNNVLGERSKVEEFTTNYQIGSFQEVVGSISDTLATRVAYKLKLRGPAFTVQSACSTSLLAVSQACQNLLTYSCDMALAGGVSITLPQKRGYIYQEGGMVARDGVCRPFDAMATGTVFASGAGVVLLKRLEDAIRDNDPVLAVIRGYGVNNDGSDKIGFTAPSARGQAHAISTALANAGFDPATVSYVECHGTATPLGDPIEFDGLRTVFSGSENRKAKCALGSLKGNIGHMDAAAGVSSLIKVVLAMRHGKIPGMANFSAPNRHIDLTSSPFYIPSSTADWPASDLPRRAGVSSFGVGGTNIHVVLEDWPRDLQQTATDDQKPVVLPLSARNEPALTAMRANLSGYLTDNPSVSLTRVAKTLQTGRHAFKYRTSIVASDAVEAARLLSEEDGRFSIADETAPLVFMFPGQGAQYVGMGASLYNSEPEFARWINRGSELVKLTLNFDPRDYICHTGTVSKGLEEEQRETVVAQPCLYLTEYALARLWLSRGLKPDAMIGHSVGEFAAATLANVMSFEDGLRLVAARGRLMQSQPPGAMVSVRASAETVEGYLRDGVEIAAVNAPNLCVVAGAFTAIDEVCARFERAGIAFSRLHTSHAFHSRMMEPIIGALCDEATKLTYGAATLPYISCVTGGWQEDGTGTSPLYWARHCREAVQFSQGIQTVSAERKPVFLEVGPGRTLSVFATQTVGRDGAAAVIQSMPEYGRAHTASETLARAHSQLWAAGCELEWPPLPPAVRSLPLPSYPFQRQRYWIDAPPSARRALKAASPRPQQVQEAAVAASFETLTIQQKDEAHPMNIATPISNHIASIETSLLALLSEMSGETIGPDQKSVTFLELGFDSLFVGQFAQKIEKQYGIKLSFRELLSNIPSVAALAKYLDSELPPDEQPAPQPQMTPPAAAPLAPSPVPVLPPAPITLMDRVPLAETGQMSTLQSVLQSQIQMTQMLFAQQLQILQAANVPGGAPAPLPAAAVSPTISSAPVAATPKSVEPAPAESVEIGADRIKLYKPGQSKTVELSEPTRSFIADLITAYEAKHRKSKTYTEANRARLADPRTASGFRLDLKEIIFPLVASRSKGSRIWDIDGNEYIDLVNGFGQTAFGHAPDFVVEAIKAQADLGYAIGPQTPLAGEVADLISGMTGHERVTFCNTGSEAVMAAMRVARTVTGNDRIVIFANDYHGQFDEVLVKGRNTAGNPVALPIAAGIPRESVANMTVLQYGAPASLDWVRANAADIAAVIIEPVQSRHPELRPMVFVKELRDIATQSGFALVFDEVVTGFRVDPGGMQAIWGIKGDMATYGKVLGGGMPIGVLAGDKRFMDALDGGHWNYGDDSVPMTAPTFFAGTFVRHPIVLAATRATLQHIKGSGSELYSRVAARTEALVAEINSDLSARGIRQSIHGYKSWFVTDFGSQDPLGALLYVQLRLNGIYIQEGYPCFLTTQHSEEDFRQIARAFRDSVDMLQSVGILSADGLPKTPLVAPTPPSPAVRPESSPLTEAQSEIWLAAQSGDEASCSFNESASLTLDGHFDRPAFLKALDLVVSRHDALHIRFDRVGDKFTFIPDFKLDVEVVDLTGDEDRASTLLTLIDDEAHIPFDLVNGPLARASLVQLAERSHVLVFTAHHIICDGFSMNIVFDELATAYSAFTQGLEPKLEPAVSFADYAMNLAPKTDIGGATAQFWIDQFREVPELPDMPYDRPHPDRRTFSGGTCTGHIDAEVYKTLKKSGARAGATLFSTLLAMLQVMITRLSAHPDVVIAVPSAGQSLLDNQTLVGHCVNLLPLRQRVDMHKTFETHLKATQQVVLKAFEHQDFTYGTLIRTLDIKRDPHRLPLTGIQFNLERVGSGAEFAGLAAKVAPNPKAFSNFDMFLNMIEGPDGIRIDVDYNADVLDRETVDRWIGHFATLAQALASDMSKRIATLPLLNEAERTWLVDGLNGTAADYDRDQFMFSLFARKAAEHPEKIAAVHRDDSITYGALEARSNQLARHIAASVPGQGERIALLTERSLDMLVALLAIMKAGHTYVPLDPAHPESRLRQTLDAAHPAAIIGDSALANQVADGKLTVIRLDEEKPAINELPASAIDDLPTDVEASAYVIFTSGSTGTPKGVEVSHRALVNFLQSMAQEPGLSADDVLVAVTTITFDIAGLELYLPLITGARTVIADRDQVQDGFALVRLLEQSGATVLQATPTLWQMLVEAGIGERPGLKMLCGGEPLPRDLAKALVKSGRELWNMYGPTETTIWSSLQRIADDDAPITIGHPIANTQLQILDAHDQVVPVGVVGELHIGGDGLARGYFERPDLTEKAFVLRDIGNGQPQRLYRTGDIGRRLPDGSLQLLGRRDNQIKLRGFRIELGDIEAVVSSIEGIQQCAVVPVRNSNGEPTLVCYFVAALNSAEPSSASLNKQAQAHLPSYMIPSFWEMVGELPQTANGKLDRKALESKGIPQHRTEVITTPPRTPMEEKLAVIWKDVLHIENIGVEDNLYALGADSLTIFRIAARMIDAGLPLEAKHLLRHPSIAELADFAEQQKNEAMVPAYQIPSLKDFRNGARRRVESIS
jgi:amino acid adenylation domain-containing protein